MPAMSDPAWTQPFLTALRRCGVMSEAARQIGIGPTAVYARKSVSTDFAAAVAEAMEEATDRMEAEMIRRAVEGVDEPVVYQGRLAYREDFTQPPDPETGLRPLLLDGRGQPVPLTVNKRSDTLLMFGLKGRRAAYRIERQEHTGADGAPLMPQLTEIERASRVAALVALAQHRQAVAGDDDADMC